MTKKAIVNVQNQDNRCLGFPVRVALHPGAHEPQHAFYYYRHFAEHGLDQLQYPVSPDQVPQLEEQLNLRINVFSFFDDEGKGRVPLDVSQRDWQEIDLLYFQEHWAWIKNFSRFMGGINQHHGGGYYWCKRWLGHFRMGSEYLKHQQHCMTDDVSTTVMTMAPLGTVLKFKIITNKQDMPFLVFADFECIVERID